MNEGEQQLGIDASDGQYAGVDTEEVAKQAVRVWPLWPPRDGER